MNKNTAPASRYPAPLIIADLDQSEQGDLITLATDWERAGMAFPTEYLDGVIAALQRIQAQLAHRDGADTK